MTGVLLVVFIAALAFGFARNKDCLLNGLDGTSWRITLQAQAADRKAFTQTGVDPYQGSFDAYYPVFYEYLLPDALAMLGGDGIPGKVVTYTSYAAFLLVAAFLLGRAVCLDRPTALLGGVLLPLMSMPYFFHSAGLFYPLFSLNPHIAQIVGLSLLIVACFWALDAGRGCGRLVLIPVPVLCLLLAIMSLVPYIALMIPATLVYGGASFLSPRRWRDNWPRLIAGLLMVAVPCGLGVVTYMRGLIGYSAYAFFSGDFEQTRGGLIFASTLFWPGPWGKILIALGLCGAVWLALSRSGRIRLFAVTHLVATSLFLVVALLIVRFATSYQGPSPVYFETCFWAYSLLFAAAALVEGMRILVHLLCKRYAGFFWLTGREGYLVLAVILFPVLTLNAFGKVHGRYQCSGIGFAPVRNTPITAVLRKTVAIGPGVPFRGLVATVDGVGHRPSITWFELHTYDWHVWHATGNEHRLVGLWKFAVPTLFQYFSFITPPYYLLLTDFLARPSDEQSRSVVVLSRIDPPIMQLWGVRYVVTDSSADIGVTAASLPVGHGAPLRLVELPRPNLGDYSPTKVRQAPDFRIGLRILHEPDFDGTQTVITDQPLSGPFLPARNAALIYEKYGFHLTADSPGRSILVLPAQYSHCWSATGTGDPHLFRADLMQLGIAFQGRLDVHLVFRFGPIYAGQCRVDDLGDMKRLKIEDARKPLLPVAR